MKFFTKSLFILMAVMVTVAGAQERWYKYEVGKPYTFIGESKQNIQQSAMGQTMNIKIESNTAYSITVLEYLEDGAMKAQLDVKSAVMFSEGPQGMQTFGDDLANKSFTYVIDNEGHVKDLDSMLTDLKDESKGLAADMADFLPKLPADKLEEGESWEVDVVDTTDAEDRHMVTSRESDYEIEGTAEVDGVSTLNIKQVGEVSMEGERKVGGTEYNVMGEGTFEGHIYLAKDLGIVKKTELTSTMEQVISQPSNPQIQITLTMSITQTVEQLSE